MKSIKPGRGPSTMSAVVGILLAIFGLFFIAGASKISGAIGSVNDSAGSIASIVPLFGGLFVIVVIAGVVYNLKNATSKDRFSTFDITDESEESDPLNELFGEKPPQPPR